MKTTKKLLKELENKPILILVWAIMWRFILVYIIFVVVISFVFGLSLSLFV